jgi:hypothetical protein
MCVGGLGDVWKSSWLVDILGRERGRVSLGSGRPGDVCEFWRVVHRGTHGYPRVAR